ncbi:MAG: hypothetical protein GX881_08510 [Firmicutes bacterium]|nr:hypothetical protein [Bacillota bacterium]
MKKKVLIGLAVFAAAALLAAGVWAWFTATADTAGTFTAGTVAIATENTYGDVANWNPGDTSEEEITVKNTGSKDIYVRVELTSEWGALTGDDFAADPSLATSNVTLECNTTDWVESGVYYYYKGVLSAGAETENLLNEVTLAGSGTNNDYQGKTFRITAEAEAVQASHDAYKDMWNLSGPPW